MKKYTPIIAIALFSSLTALNAEEMISLHSVSEIKGEEYNEMKYLHGDSEEVIYVHKTPIVSTKDISTVTIGDTPLTIIVKLSEQGRKKLTEGTTGMTGKRIALTVNGVIRFAPVMAHTPLGGQFQIEGFKNQEEAKSLVEAFNKTKG
jgi:preprotein translocase subunit SecD